MDRKMLKLPFTLDRTPGWQCPTCGSGVLQIKKGSFHHGELCGSRGRQHLEEWDPEWTEYVYSCLLVCSNSQCQEVVSSSGVGTIDFDVYQDANGDPSQDFRDEFRPRYFEPCLLLLTIPEKCPEAVSAPLRDSFRLFFISPSAASNSVRIAIEALLTDLKVKRFSTPKGRRRFIALHQRIELIPPKYSALKEHLLAIKWLGNAGSHDSSDSKAQISADDVLDSYEFTEHVLQEIYAPKAKTLLARAKKVNKKRGPIK